MYLLDGTPADSPQAGTLGSIVEQMPQTAQSVDYRNVPEVINSMAKEMERRQSADETEAPPIFLFVHGLQRYRVLRKSEDSFSFSASDEEKPPATDKQFADLLRDGPNFGIHVIAWADTAATLDRTLDRATMREFDNRVLMQMSATDSSNLMDSPAANKLGIFRALLYSEEQGVMEKFRPYSLPDIAWIDQLKAKARK
jgi:DNA segregation ATPase FtsK/SpoIIIE, S-DNA-T family